MNLWILSQDGKHFFPNPKLSVEAMNGYGYIVDDSTQTILGEYESESRAKEIIKNIKNYVVDNKTFEGDYEKSDLFVKTMIWRNMVKVYEMPKE